VPPATVLLPPTAGYNAVGFDPPEHAAAAARIASAAKIPKGCHFELLVNTGIPPLIYCGCDELGCSPFPVLIFPNVLVSTNRYTAGPRTFPFVAATAGNVTPL